MTDLQSDSCKECRRLAVSHHRELGRILRCEQKMSDAANCFDLTTFEFLSRELSRLTAERLGTEAALRHHHMFSRHLVPVRR